MTKRWRICDARQPKFMVCCPSFCSFSPVLVVAQVLTYIFSLCLLFHGDDGRAKPQLTFKVSACYCSLVLFFVVSEKI